MEDPVFGSGGFGDLGLEPRLAAHLHGAMGFQSPTVVQKSAIPLLLSGRDLLVNARTGTGKTLVYLAPIVHGLQAREPKITRTEGTFAVILVPTRELCIQVCGVAEQLVHRFHWLVPGHIMGGENRAKEKARLRKGITILIATPGRLLDHLKNTASFQYDFLQWIVFDEADRLLDMGFEKDIRSILDFLGTHQRNGSKRQHVLLSATLNDRVNKLAKISLCDPATIGLSSTPPEGAPDLDTNANIEYSISDKLQQCVLKVSSKIRLVTLLALLRLKLYSTKGSYKIVVFFSTCDAVDFHHTVMSRFSWVMDDGSSMRGRFLDCDIFKLHGNVEQRERTDTFHKFSQAERALLLCTDVAARGLDFKGLSFIVQYDPPGEPVDYVHRVGRTARLGRKGEAALFLQPCEAEYVQELRKHGVVLKDLDTRKVLDSIYTISQKRSFASVDVAEMHPAAAAMQTALESFVTSEGDLKQLAVNAFRSSVRAYAVHREGLRKIFQVRMLHLGHVAKSFALRDAPSGLSKCSAQKASKRMRAEKKRAGKKRRLHAAKME
ncbi:DEAD-box ATP-dependent RNA helicase 17 [Selaginella moellendorffii]|nr:DEAD-box ATP-dependent RNA helicase 17 [Selaginella moellendorffii]|eukprot:XP_002964093.2 DEAD-box ATP-dependent RNA helicase 17 [Selaginella moellendorffii]